MRQHEAEREAEDRNRHDSRRDKFVFYALDQSAGIAEDAWEVATRLRRPDEFQWQLPDPVDVRAAGDSDGPPQVHLEEPAAPPAVEAQPTVAAEPVFEEPPAAPAVEPLQPTVAAEPVFHEPAAPPPLEPEPTVAAEPVFDEPTSPPPTRRRRGSLLLRLWGVFVLLVGVAFTGATIAIAVSFRDYLQIHPLIFAGFVAAGVFAVWVGVEIARR